MLRRKILGAFRPRRGAGTTMNIGHWITEAAWGARAFMGRLAGETRGNIAMIFGSACRC